MCNDLMENKTELNANAPEFIPTEAFTIDLMDHKTEFNVNAPEYIPTESFPRYFEDWKDNSWLLNDN